MHKLVQVSWGDEDNSINVAIIVHEDLSKENIIKQAREIALESLDLEDLKGEPTITDRPNGVVWVEYVP